MPPLDADTVSRVGAALATSLGRPRISVVVGCDTRASSDGHRRGAFRAGSRRPAAPSRFAGVVPTPAVAWLDPRARTPTPASSSRPRTIPGTTTASRSSRRTAASSPTPSSSTIERHIDDAAPRRRPRPSAVELRPRSGLRRRTSSRTPSPPARRPEGRDRRGARRGLRGRARRVRAPRAPRSSRETSRRTAGTSTRAAAPCIPRAWRAP